MRSLSIGFGATVLAGSLLLGGAAAAGATENRAPVCQRYGFTPPAQGETVAIPVMTNDFDPDGDALALVDVFGARDGTVAIGDNGTPDDTTDDVVLYTRTAPVPPGGGASPLVRAERLRYRVTDGQLTAQCSSNYFPSNFW